MFNKISVVINTLNEEKYICRCLESIKWADEIVVVDMYSEDKTIAICEKYTKNIFFHEKTSHVEPAREFSVNKASNEWIFIVDADEIIPVELKDKLRQFVLSPGDFEAVEIPKKEIVFGKWIRCGCFWPNWHLRFFKKNSIKFYNRPHIAPKCFGKVHRFPESQKFAIIHDGYPDIDSFVRKVNNYTTRDIDVRYLENKDLNFKKRDLFIIPVKHFIYRFIRKKGYKDRMHGFILSVLMAFHYFLIYAKLWERQKKD